MNRYARWTVRLIGPAVLAWFLAATDLNRIAANLRGVHWAPLLLSLALYPGLILIKTWRWDLLMRNLDMRVPPLRYSMVLYMIGQFAGGATPGQSGDFIKAWYLRERGSDLASALFSILLDRLFDFLVMALLSLVGLVMFLHLFPQRFQNPILSATLGSAAAIVLIVPTLMWRRSRDWVMRFPQRFAPERARNHLEHWRARFASLNMRAGLMGVLSLTSCAAAAWVIARLWLLFRAMDVTVPVPVLICSVALISIIQTLPISFAGVGVRDAILVAVLGSYGYAPEKALALSALFLLLTIEQIIIGFLVSLKYPLGSPTHAGRAFSDP